MLRLLRTLLASGEPPSHYVHYHLDDRGRRRFCDESACRPSSDPLLRPSLPLIPPFR